MRKGHSTLKSAAVEPPQGVAKTRGKPVSGGLAVVLLLCLALSAPQAGASLFQSDSANKTSAAAKAEFAEAERLFKQGLLESARAAVLRGLEENSRSVAGYNLLGIIEIERRDYERAVAAFEQALKTDSHSTVTHNNLGNCYVAQNKLNLAEKEFRSTLRLDPGNRDTNFNLGLVLLAQGRPGQAVEYFRAVSPPDATTLINLTRAYLRSGQIARALELARKISEQSKSDVRVHFSLGVLLATEKQYDAAVHELELADALKPGTVEILHDLGQAYLREGKYDKAEGVLGRALALSPDSPDTLYLLAQVYAEQRKALQALELLLKARKLAPGNTDIIFLMGRLSMMQSYFEDAIQVLEEGLKIAPERADLHAALGESYFTVGKVDKATQEFQTLIRLDPSARSYVFMGLCYRHLGRFDEARKYLKEGLKKDPHNAACLYNLGFIENKQGNYPEAEKVLEEAVKASPNYDDALYELASVKIAQKKYEDALPLLKRCAKLTTKSAQVYYKLATAERVLRQSDAAERDLKIFETLSKDPSAGPYPFQHFFESVNQRMDLPPRQKAELDLQELLQVDARRPNQPRILYLLAETYLKVNQFDEARKTVARMDEVSGGDVRTALGMGELLARYKLYPEAIRHFQAALRADPGSDDAKYNLANAYFQVHDYSRALDAVEQCSPQSRNDEAFLALMADIDAHLGRTAEATRIFEKAIEKNPDNDQYYLSQALTQLRAGNTGAAQQALRRGLTRTPDSGRILWGLGVVSVLEGKNAQAEEYLKRALDLMPEWQGAYSTLGLFYFQTAQIPKARETFEHYQRAFPQGGIDIGNIQKLLATVFTEPQPPKLRALSPENRQRFLEIALALADQGI